MNTSPDETRNQSNNALTTLQTIERITHIPGITDIITINGFVGKITGSFNDEDGLLVGDSYELHPFTSYILLDIGPRADMPPAINFHGEGQR